MQALVERLRGIDPNDLRPREALDLLYELHELAAAPDNCHQASDRQDWVSEAEVLAGEVPDPARPPSGCRFHPRCIHQMDQCRATDPPSFAQGPGRQVSCWLADPSLARVTVPGEQATRPVSDS